MAKDGEIADMELDVPAIINGPNPTLDKALHLLEKKLQEDQSQKKSKCLLPLRVNFDLTQNDLSKLKQLWEKVKPCEREKFKDLYGDIALLLDVKVEENLLTAALYCWNPSYRCFVFGKHDMVPTVEEYQSLLRVKKAKPSKIFMPKKESARTLGRMVGLGIEEMKRHMDGEYFKTGYLMEFVERKQGTGKGLEVLAFLIYGLVIFPKRLEHIHLSVLALFTGVQHQTDPSAAILSETIRSLNFCRKNDGRFEACAQLLTMWFKSHFGYKRVLGISFKDDESAPMDYYGENQWPPEKDAELWEDWLRNLDDGQITWTARWSQAREIPFIHVKIPWVPLVGLWGTISYSPLLVRRQYGSEQFIPLTGYLSTLDFPHDTPDQNEEAKLWGELYKQACKLERDSYMENVISEYPIWHQERNALVPFTPNEDYPTIEKPVDEFRKLKIENRKLREGIEISELSQECEQLKWVNQQLEEKLKKKSMKKIDLIQEMDRERANSEKMKAKADDWEGEATKVSKTAAKYWRARHDSTRRWVNARIQSEQIQNKRDQLKKNNDELSCLVGSLKLKNEELEQQVRELTDKLTESESQNAEMRIQLG